MQVGCVRPPKCLLIPPYLSAYLYMYTPYLPTRYGVCCRCPHARWDDLVEGGRLSQVLNMRVRSLEALLHIAGIRIAGIIHA